MRWKRRNLFIAILAISIHLLGLAGSAQAFGSAEMGLYREEGETNINQTNEPVIFHGWIEYTGVSVRPLIVNLWASCGVGDTILTQSEFVFHLPENKTYDLYLLIYEETINGTVSQLSIGGTWTQGVSTGSIGGLQCPLLILNYDDNPPSYLPSYEALNQERDDGSLLPNLISTCIILSGIIIVLLRRKMKKRL